MVSDERLGVLDMHQRHRRGFRFDVPGVVLYVLSFLGVHYEDLISLILLRKV
jgi:hypothetical protein